MAKSAESGGSYQLAKGVAKAKISTASASNQA